MLAIRTMMASELPRLGEIDRSEEISQEYVHRGGTLHLKDVHWSVPAWDRQGCGGHSVAAKIAAWKPWLGEDGTMLGAFDADALVAFAIYRPHLSPGVAQFAVLHVSRPYRRQGLGKALATNVIQLARDDGATCLYVSAAPTRGTVDFYQSLGFGLAQEANCDLFNLEPDDIHMTLPL
jgi:GNAT superfamily N-acetyltransferase